MSDNDIPRGDGVAFRLSWCGLSAWLVATVVVLAGCGAPTVMVVPTSPLAPGRGQPSGNLDSQRWEEAGEADGGQGASPDYDRTPWCADYDSWRPNPQGTGITVRYWFEGTDPVTVVVRYPGGPELSQTAVANDPTRRYRDFDFFKLGPQSPAEVLVTSGDTRCVVQAITRAPD